MPGHLIPPSQTDRVRRDFDELERLIDGHDVVFLGMDSRESRWLPTVMGAAKSKVSASQRVDQPAAKELTRLVSLS